MPYRYCVNSKCNNGDPCPLGEPTVLEDLFAEQKCPVCKTSQPQLKSPEEYLVQAFDEIKELRRTLMQQGRKINKLKAELEEQKVNFNFRMKRN